MSRTTAIYLTSYTLSLLGNGIASVLFPLLVLARTGDVLAAGLLASIMTAVGAVLGVFAGAVVDRVNRRTVSIVSDVLSAGSIAALPVVDALWGLDLTWFIVLGVIGAFGDIPGMTARETMLPRLVRVGGGGQATLDRLVGVRESLSGLAMIVGPGIGGLLVLTTGIGSTALIVTALTSLLAALLTLAMSPRVGEIELATEGGPRGVAQVASDLAAGWRFLIRQRLVLSATVLSAVLIAVIVALQSTVLPAYFTLEGLPQLSGMAATGIAAGGLVGAVLFATTVGRVSRRRWFVVGIIGIGVGFMAIGSMASPALVIGAAVLIGLANAPMSAVLGVATIEATPDAIRGRVLGAQNAIILAAPALTAAPFAAIAARCGLDAAGIAIAAVISVTAIVALLARPFTTLDAPAATMAEATETQEA